MNSDPFDDRQVGVVTSSTWSHSLKTTIAMAMIRFDLVTSGTAPCVRYRERSYYAERREDAISESWPRALKGLKLQPMPRKLQLGRGQVQAGASISRVGGARAVNVPSLAPHTGRPPNSGTTIASVRKRLLGVQIGAEYALAGRRG